VVGGDTVSVATTGGSYDTKDTGSGKTVSVSGLTLAGTDAGDYSLGSTSITGAVGKITPKSITASLTGSVSKTYDATTSVTLGTANYQLSGILGGDTVWVDETSGSYDTKNVGTGKMVTAGDLLLSGGQAGDYVLSNTSASAPIGTITQKSVTASLTGTVSKTYDGTTAATLASANYSLTGVLAGDTVSLNDPSAGTYSSANVGTGRGVSVGGLALSGSGAADYRLSASTLSASIGTITPRPITATADDSGKSVGLADPSLTYSVTSGSLAQGDAFTGAVTRDPGNTPGDYDINQGTLALNSNYSLTFVPGLFTVTGPIINGGGGGQQNGENIPDNLPSNVSETLTPPGASTSPGPGPLALTGASPGGLPYPSNVWISPDIHFSPAPP
jgi:hypothetical protein